MNPACALRETYPDASSMETFYNVAVRNVLAPFTDDGSAQVLLLGASSNIVIESSGDAKMYVKDNSGFMLYQSDFIGGIRCDHALFDVRSNVALDGVTKATVLSTGADENAMWVYGSDANRTTWISSTKVNNVNDTSAFSTTQSAGFLMNAKTHFTSNIICDQDVYMRSTLEVDSNVTFYGNFFTKNVNMWSDTSSVVASRVGFAFTINDKSQLQLIKHIEFPEAAGLSNVTKTIAVFGGVKALEEETTDVHNSYFVFDELSGIGMHTPGLGGGSGGAGSAADIIATTSAWQFGNNSELYTFNKVGINNDSPTVELDVVGSIMCSDTITTVGMNASSIMTQAITTTSDERLKEIRGTIAPASCLSKLSQLDVIDFAYLNAPVADEFKAGLRAQQVEAVMADAVIVKAFAGLDDCRLIDTSVMLAYIVGAIKELAAR